MPLYLPNHAELIVHVHGVVVGLDLGDLRRTHSDFVVWMVRFVHYLTAFMGEDGVAHGFGRECELHRESALERGLVASLPRLGLRDTLNVPNLDVGCRQNSLSPRSLLLATRR